MVSVGISEIDPSKITGWLRYYMVCCNRRDDREDHGGGNPHRFRACRLLEVSVSVFVSVLAVLFSFEFRPKSFVIYVYEKPFRRNGDSKRRGICST